MGTGEFADARFAKYAESGAYHWREVGRGLIAHNAFTAERYRRVIAGAALRDGDRVLDYGCGDGALLGVCTGNRAAGATICMGSIRTRWPWSWPARRFARTASGDASTTRLRCVPTATSIA